MIVVLGVMTGSASGWDVASRRPLRLVELAADLVVGGIDPLGLGLAVAGLDLLDLGVGRGPGDRAEVVDEELAVEVVGLVLDRPAEEVLGVDLDRVAVEVVGPDLDLPGSADLARRGRGSSGSLPRSRSEECRLTISGLMKTCSWSGCSGSAVRFRMKNRSGMPTWLAARPIPLEAYIRSNISRTVARSSSSIWVTGRDSYRRAGCG